MNKIQQQDYDTAKAKFEAENPGHSWEEQPRKFRMSYFQDVVKEEAQKRHQARRAQREERSRQIEFAMAPYREKWKKNLSTTKNKETKSINWKMVAVILIAINVVLIISTAYFLNNRSLVAPQNQPNVPTSSRQASSDPIKIPTSSNFTQDIPSQSSSSNTYSTSKGKYSIIRKCAGAISKDAEKRYARAAARNDYDAINAMLVYGELVVLQAGEQVIMLDHGYLTSKIRTSRGQVLYVDTEYLR